MDEARFGLKSWHRRRWCPRGFRPPWIFEDEYEWLWLYAAVEPTTGESFCLYLPRLDGECFEVFLKEFEKSYPDEEVVLVLDGAPGHRSGEVKWPSGIEGLRLPARSPELNPAERWFEELRARLSNRIFESEEEMMEALTEALRPYWEAPEVLARLVGYGWWLEGISNTRTSA
jgi:transposase